MGSRVKRVNDLFVPWPPSVWVTSHAAGEPNIPNLATAVVTDAVVKGDNIHLFISDGVNLSSVALAVPKGENPETVAKAILASKGRSLSEAGDQVIG